MAAKTSGAVLRVLNNWNRREFLYGDCDCCQFSAWVVHQLTGRNLLAGLSYQGEAAAEALIEQHGGLEGAVTAHLGREPVALEALRPGDLVLWRARGRDGVGVVVRPGAQTFATVTAAGDLALLPRGLAKKGWTA